MVFETRPRSRVIQRVCCLLVLVRCNPQTEDRSANLEPSPLEQGQESSDHGVAALSPSLGGLDNTQYQ